VSALDGALVFTLKDVLINNESNSPYGTFKIEIFDSNRLLASGEYISNQSIIPLTMVYTSTTIYNSQKILVTGMETGDENLTYVLNFTIAY